LRFEAYNYKTVFILIKSTLYHELDMGYPGLEPGTNRLKAE